MMDSFCNLMNQMMQMDMMKSVMDPWVTSMTQTKITGSKLAEAQTKAELAKTYMQMDSKLTIDEALDLAANNL